MTTPNPKPTDLPAAVWRLVDDWLRSNPMRRADLEARILAWHQGQLEALTANRDAVIQRAMELGNERDHLRADLEETTAEYRDEVKLNNELATNNAKLRADLDAARGELEREHAAHEHWCAEAHAVKHWLLNEYPEMPYEGDDTLAVVQHVVGQLRAAWTTCDAERRELQQTIEHLNGPCDYSKKVEAVWTLRDKALAERDAALATARRLRAALEPFAALASYTEDLPTEDHLVSLHRGGITVATITVADVRKAREALTDPTPKAPK